MSQSSTTALADRWNAVMMSNYGTPTLELVRGSGSIVWDRDGSQYLDLVAGIATSSLGHAHPAVAAAVAKQSELLIHTSNLYAHDVGLELAERLVGLVGLPGRVFFSQDGATAIEAALKLTRLHASQFDPIRTEIIAMEGSFHGRTMGALSLTGSPPKQDPFKPLLPGVRFVPYGDLDAVADVIGPQTAAVFVEPAMGEAGVIVPPVDYLPGLRRLCTDNGALLVVDEVQSGIGRTGSWFASRAQGIDPDILTLAKGIAGGMPLGVCIGMGATGHLFRPGNHGSTFGGNPVSCAAALAVIDTIEADHLLDHVNEIAAYFGDQLRRLSPAWASSVRQYGLWFGVTFKRDVAPTVQQIAQRRGFLVNAVGPDTLRFAPALTISQEEVESFTDVLPEIVAEAWEQP